MRRMSIAAFLAVSLLLMPAGGRASANGNPAPNLGCGGFCMGLFKGIHQHGPLFNYGPYYGYYPFKPYGPWDAYLRYDPYFYGDPYANWQGRGQGGDQDSGNRYGRNQNLHGFPRLGLLHHGGLPGLGLFHHKGGCLGCHLSHASWLHGGWFRGHSWLHGGKSGGHGLFHKSGCSSCGGLAVATPTTPTGDATTRYSGFGNPTQSAVYYSATPTLNPVLELVPTAGQTK